MLLYREGPGLGWVPQDQKGSLYGETDRSPIIANGCHYQTGERKEGSVHSEVPCIEGWGSCAVRSKASCLKGHETMQLYQGGGLTQGTPKATGDIFKLSCIAITNTVFARQNRTSILL